MTSLSVIIPACNEGRRIGPTVESYATHLSARYDLELIVVMNGCTDGTDEVVSGIARKNGSIRPLTFRERLGKGGAVVEGLRAAHGDIVGFTDADGSTDAAEFERLVAALAECDATIASRWLPGSSVPARQPLMRRVASRGFNLLVRLLLRLPFRDTQCGAKVFRRQAIERVLSRLRVANFAFDVELLYRLMQGGCVVKEVPITWRERCGSTVSMRKAIPAMFSTVLRLKLEGLPFERPRWTLNERNPVQSIEG